MTKLFISDLSAAGNFIHDLRGERPAQSLIGGNTAAVSFAAAQYYQIGSTPYESAITGSAAISSRGPIDISFLVTPNLGFVNAKTLPI
jgi:hypothetical protein